jgi:hypothetical protein
VLGQSTIPSLTDTTLILKRPPKRLVYQQEKGVFLNELQEQITLEKLLWKEVYRQDAVSMYWINVALEERIVEVMAINERLRQDLSLAETSSIRATAGMEHYRGLFKDMEAENIKLRNSNRNLKASNLGFKIGTVTFGLTTVYLGIRSIIR